MTLENLFAHIFKHLSKLALNVTYNVTPLNVTYFYSNTTTLPLLRLQNTATFKALA